MYQMMKLILQIYEKNLMQIQKKVFLFFNRDFQDVYADRLLYVSFPNRVQLYKHQWPHLDLLFLILRHFLPA